MTTGQVIRWWEFRRLLYNAVLLVVGVAAIAGMEWLMGQVVPMGEDAIEPMALALGVAVYGIMANLCYTLGWVVEVWGRKADPVAARLGGQWMFRGGPVVLMRADEPSVLFRLCVLDHASRSCSLILF